MLKCLNCGTESLKNCVPGICELCGKNHDRTYGSGRFCSKSCSAGFSTKNDNAKEIKFCKCIKCNKNIGVNKRHDLNRVICKDCKEKKRSENRRCKYCGQNICLRKDICKKFRILPALVNFFGFDEKKLEP